MAPRGEEGVNDWALGGAWCAGEGGLWTGGKGLGGEEGELQGLTEGVGGTGKLAVHREGLLEEWGSKRQERMGGQRKDRFKREGVGRGERRGWATDGY